MRKGYLGIDNGVSGSLGLSDGNGSILIKTPVKKCLNYQKSKERYINRLDFDFFYDFLKTMMRQFDEALVILERPMVNGLRFQASISGVRCLEAQLIAIERLKLPYYYIDSKEWQREFFPKKIKEKSDLKEVSRQIGKRMFPSIDFEKFKDADGLLISEYARRKKL